MNKKAKIENVKKETVKKPHRKANIRGKSFLVAIFIVLLTGILIYLFTSNLINSIVIPIIFLLLFDTYLYTSRYLKKSSLVKKAEDAFPDFIELMASNLRAGMTIDRAILASSRKEFAPLDKEILVLGKDIVTGKEITHAMKDLSKRVGSEKIQKTIDIIISGIKAGGNLSILLQETATNMRERAFVEKKAASNVLMYVIFIVFAVAAGAPLLFGLSSVLVQIMTQILSNVPEAANSPNLMFTMSKISISVDFITYFSIVFLLVIDFLASLILGAVAKGNEKAGMKYFIPLLAASISVYFAVRFFIASQFSGIV